MRKLALIPALLAMLLTACVPEMEEMCTLTLYPSWDDANAVGYAYAIQETDEAGAYATSHGVYPKGTRIELEAEAASELRTFDHWSDGSTENPRIITLNDDAEYTAYFKVYEPDDPDPDPDPDYLVRWGSSEWEAVYPNVADYGLRLDGEGDFWGFLYPTNHAAQIPVIYLGITESAFTTGNNHYSVNEYGYPGDGEIHIEYLSAADSVLQNQEGTTIYGNWWAKEANIHIYDIDLTSGVTSMEINATMYDAYAYFLNSTPIDDCKTKPLYIRLLNVPFSIAEPSDYSNLNMSSYSSLPSPTYSQDNDNEGYDYFFGIENVRQILVTQLQGGVGSYINIAVSFKNSMSYTGSGVEDVFSFWSTAYGWQNSTSKPLYQTTTIGDYVTYSSDKFSGCSVKCTKTNIGWLLEFSQPVCITRKQANTQHNLLRYSTQPLSGSKGHPTSLPKRQGRPGDLRPARTLR